MSTHVEDLLTLQHGTLRNLISGRQDPSTLRANAQALIVAPYLIVQYLLEEAESLASANPRKAQLLRATAQRITQLHNETLLIPTQRSQLDGPTDLLRPKTRRKKN